MENIQIYVPESIENKQLPNPELLTYFSDLEDRIIWIDSEIDESTLLIVKQILAWNREDKEISIEERKPIKLYFFSPGGDLDVNNALIDVITFSKTPVWGINLNRCCSAAAFIFLSCHKRFMMPNAYFIFHQGSGAFQGSFQEIQSQIEDYQEAVCQLTEFMLSRTSYSTEEVMEKIVGEWYVRKNEAIEKGVCDKVITSLEEIN